MDFRNSTALDSDRLAEMFERYSDPYSTAALTVRVRYSRKADFSGTCYYRDARLFINLGRHNRYPYTMGTHIARARSNATHWWRETFQITLFDAYQLALFVYLHELFHHLVKVSGRNPRRKESMCDRFATRALVDHFNCPLRDSGGRPVARADWDFQNLEQFVGRAPRRAALPAPVSASPGPRAIPVTIRGLAGEAAATRDTQRGAG